MSDNTVTFPEDIPMDEWVENQMRKNHSPDKYGRSEVECRVELGSHWVNRKRSFEEDLAEIRNNVLEKLPPGEPVTYKDLVRALDVAMVTVITTVKGYSPILDKYSLNTYIGTMGKNENGEPVLNERIRPIELNVEQYFKAVNS